jgi:hypothetical protein
MIVNPELLRLPATAELRSAGTAEGGCPYATLDGAELYVCANLGPLGSNSTFSSFGCRIEMLKWSTRLALIECTPLASLSAAKETCVQQRRNISSIDTLNRLRS